MTDGWKAVCSDGSVHNETWRPNELSPWQLLMQYCKQQRCYVQQLTLFVGSEYLTLKDAPGFWQAHGQNIIQGVQLDSELNKVRGIGVVQADLKTVLIYWIAYNQDNNPFCWTEQRDAESQHQIIWSYS